MTGGRWSVVVDSATCGGSGLCIGCAPAYFELDAERRSRARNAVIEPAEAVADAAECCPMEAITVADLETGQQLYPQSGPIR